MKSCNPSLGPHSLKLHQCGVFYSNNLYNRVCRWRLSQMCFTHLPMLYPAWQQVLGQDKQFDSLHWFESARKHYRAEKARLEEGLDTDSNTSGLAGLQIWSQKLASISDADVQNMQLVCIHFLPPHGFVSVYWDLWNHCKVQASKKNCSMGCVCLGISLGWEAVTSCWVGNCRRWSEWQATWWSLSLLTTTSPEPEYSFYEEVNIIKRFVCNFLSLILDTKFKRVHTQQKTSGECVPTHMGIMHL